MTFDAFRKGTPMKTNTLHLLLIAAAALPMAACVVYDPTPVVVRQPTTQDRFERSWSAAAGAISDQGFAITSEDRGSGVIRGERSGASIMANVRTLADGRIQVTFDSGGSADPDLTQRVSDSYQRRMGR
jgi:hypothetical protein